MLVLTRKRDEKILIGDNIVVTVVEISGDKVRLGVDAPQDVPIVRDNAINCAPKSAENKGKPVAKAREPRFKI